MSSSSVSAKSSPITSVGFSPSGFAWAQVRYAQTRVPRAFLAAAGLTIMGERVANHGAALAYWESGGCAAMAALLTYDENLMVSAAPPPPKRRCTDLPADLLDCRSPPTPGTPPY